MTDFLIQLVEQYGYFAVFGLAFADHTGTPGGLLLSIGVATTGLLDIHTVFWVSFLGGLIGDIAFYLVGFYSGRTLLKRFSNALDKASAVFNKYESGAVLWGRFPAFIGKYVMALAGVSRYPFYKFAGLSAVGGAMMVAVYGLPYYFLGNELNELFESKFLALYLTLGIGAVHLIVSWIWKMSRTTPAR